MSSKSIHVPKSQDFVLFRKLRGLPWRLSGAESACHCKRHERPGFSGPKKSPGEGKGNRFQDSCLENPMHTSLGGYSPWVTRVGDDWVDSMHVFSLIWLVAPHWLSQSIFHIFILPTSIIIFSWKAFYFKYSSVHTSIPNSSLSVPPLFPSGNSMFFL